MPLRIGFDMDGVLADFGAAYHAIEERLYGPASPATRAGDPEDEAQIEAAEEEPAAGALTLDYHVDDSPKNCIDVKSESRARALLIVAPDDKASALSAHRLGIGTASTIGAALDILDQATLARTEPTLLARVAKMVGWK
jgi:FMN phosphatase YigB (HAD superfamily)